MTILFLNAAIQSFNLITLRYYDMRHNYFLSPIYHEYIHSVILPFKDKTKVQKSWRLKSCLRAVSEGVQNFVKLIQTINEK